MVKKEVYGDETKHTQRPEEVAKRSERPAKCLLEAQFLGLDPMPTKKKREQ